MARVNCFHKLLNRAQNETYITSSEFLSLTQWMKRVAPWASSIDECWEEMRKSADLNASARIYNGKTYAEMRKAIG